MINKKEVLNSIYKVFSETEQLTEFSAKEDNNIVDMVITEFRGVGEKAEEVLGEMFFMPQPIKDPKYEMFTISMTLEDDYKGNNRDALIEAFDFINYNLPFGAFSLDNNGSIIVLKYTLIVDPQMDMDKLLEMINYSIASLVGFSGLWMESIFDVINGKKKLDDIKARIGIK